MKIQNFYAKIMLILVVVLIAPIFMQTISVAIESANDTLQLNNPVEETSQNDNENLLLDSSENLNNKIILSDYENSETSSPQNMEKAKLSDNDTDLIRENDVNLLEQVVTSNGKSESFRLVFLWFYKYILISL